MNHFHVIEVLNVFYLLCFHQPVSLHFTWR